MAAADGLSGPVTDEALVKSLSSGLARAAEAVDSGAAAALLARWVDASNRLAPQRPGS
jgi:anthranilate phosphoribosyltransferase